MSNSARVVAFGYWGTETPAPLSLDLRTLATKRQCTFKGLELLADSDIKLNGKYDSAQADIPLILARRNAYPSSQNTTAVWGGGTYLTAVPAAFNGETAGLSHDRTGAGTGVPYTSTFSDGLNEANSVRVFLYKAPKEIKFPIWEYERADWLFRIEDGSPIIARKRRAAETNALIWTRAKQDTLDALLGNDTTVDATIDAKREEIYDIYQSVGGSSKRLKAGEFYEVTFIPEPSGVLNIFIDGEHTAVKVPDILDTREVGTVVAASTVTVRGNGIAFMWQSGYPIFTNAGTMEYRFRYRPAELDSIERDAALANFVVGGQSEYSLSGTAVTYLVERIDSVWARVLVTLTTSNNRHTPFLYSSQANLKGGEAIHNGGQAQSWDSDGALFNGHMRFENISVQCDHDSGRNVCMVTIIDVDGEAMTTTPVNPPVPGDRTPLGNNNEALENRRVNVDLNGVRYITQGIVLEASRDNMVQATELLADSARRSGRESQIVLTIANAMAVLDEHLMEADPIGDDMFLNDYTRLCFTNAGIPAWRLAGIPAGTGEVLPKAALGESAAIKPVKLSDRTGPFVRGLYEEWGMGNRLYENSVGIFTVAKTLGSLNIGFTHVSSPAGLASGQTMLGPMDFHRETAEYYNDFLFEGFTNSRGETIWVSWSLAQGWRAGINLVNEDKRHIGRKKRFYRKYDGVRTLSDLQRLARSIVYRLSAPPRFISFTTSKFFPSLFPGMTDTIDGVSVRIERIGEGRVTNKKINSQSVVCREIEPRAASIIGIFVDGE